MKTIQIFLDIFQRNSVVRRLVWTDTCEYFKLFHRMTTTRSVTWILSSIQALIFIRLSWDLWRIPWWWDFWIGLVWWRRNVGRFSEKFKISFWIFCHLLAGGVGGGGVSQNLTCFLWKMYYFFKKIWFSSNIFSSHGLLVFSSLHHAARVFFWWCSGSLMNILCFLPFLKIKLTSSRNDDRKNDEANFLVKSVSDF